MTRYKRFRYRLLAHVPSVTAAGPVIQHISLLSLLFLGLLATCDSGRADFSPPPPYFGTNPSLSDIKRKLTAAGRNHRVPPHILFGIAQQESIGGWRQFREDGRTQYHREPDGRVGVGIMQITVFPSAPDYEKLCTDIDYNIERGAQILEEKWRTTPVIGDGIGAQGREKLENWYYAVWAYNSGNTNACVNNPNCDMDGTYAERVFDWIADPPGGLWQPVDVSRPTRGQIGGPPAQPIPNTPSPVHIDANFDGVIDPTPQGDCSHEPGRRENNGSINERILAAYRENGGRDRVGCPRNNGGGTAVHGWGPERNRGEIQDFDGGRDGHGAITHQISHESNKRKAYWIHTAIWETWISVVLNGGTGPYGALGWPVSNELDAARSPATLKNGHRGGTTGRLTRFEHGTIYWSERYGGFPVCGIVGNEYHRLGGTASEYGFPVGQPYTFKRLLRTYMTQKFEGGEITRKVPLFATAYAEEAGNGQDLEPEDQPDIPPPPPPPSDCSDSVSYDPHDVDQTVPDGTGFNPNQSFTKIWRVRNSGSCSWEGYRWVFDGGHQMGGPASIEVPVVRPGDTWDPRLDLRAPGSLGVHTGYWKMQNPAGRKFGPRFFVKITVTSGSCRGKIYIAASNYSKPTVEIRRPDGSVVQGWRSFSEPFEHEVACGDSVVEYGFDPNSDGDRYNRPLTRLVTVGNGQMAEAGINYDDYRKSNRCPHAPEALGPSDGASLNSPTVHFEWKDNGDPDGNPLTFDVNIFDASGRKYDRGLNQGTSWDWVAPGPGTYTWSVHANDGTCDSGESPRRSFRILGANLSVMLSDAPDPVTIGRNLIYTILVKNSGPDTATGVQVIDSLPAGVTFVSATASQGTYVRNGHIVTSQLGALANGATAIVRIVVKPETIGTISNTARVTATQHETAPTDNTSTQNTVVRGIADLSVSVVPLPDPATVASSLVYAITVKNNGPHTATGVIVTSAVPTGASFVSAASNQGACTRTGSTIICNGGNLARSASLRVVLVVRPVSGTPLLQTARVSGNEHDPSIGNNIAVRRTRVAAANVTSRLRITQQPLSSYLLALAQAGDFAQFFNYLKELMRPDAAHRSLQVVTIQNMSNTAIAGPVSLILDNTSRGATLRGRSGITATASPLGSPYINLTVGSDNVLSPGEDIIKTLEFATPTPMMSLSFKTRVLAGPGER